MSARVGVVAMGGYNTFCEILSFGKPALIVPRTAPRQEQYLRAERARATRPGAHAARRRRARAAAHGRARCGAARLAAAAGESPIPGLLAGLERIAERGRALARADASRPRRRSA